MKYKHALDEADEKGWFPLHEAVVQPIRQILKLSWMVRKCRTVFNQTEAQMQMFWSIPNEKNKQKEKVE